MGVSHQIEPNVVTYNTLISARANETMPDDTWLREMRSFALEPDVITYSAIIYGYARYQDWNKALRLMGHMRHEGIRPTLITHSTTAVAAKGNWPWAGFVLHQMQQQATQPDIQTL